MSIDAHLGAKEIVAMKAFRTVIMGMTLIGMSVLMPRTGWAQQTDDTPSEMTSRDIMAEFARRRELAAVAQESDDEDQGGGGINVQVIATFDERTNSVVVRGPAEVLDLVADMLAALDDTTTQVAGVKIFQLRYADATNTADVINQLFGAEQDSQQSNQRGFFGPMMFRGPGGQSNEQDGSQGQVVAAADSQTNTVVVTGPDNILAVVADVIEKLDAPIPNVADVKVFHLEYADAQDTAELINEVFGESSSSRTSSSNQQNQRIQFMRGGPGGQQQATSSSGASSIEVVAAADSLTNAVVVSGPPETLKIIADVIKELDENPEQERQIFVYALKNATAENLMEILNNLFDELQALNQAGTGTTGQQFQGAPRNAQPAATTSSASSASGGANDLDEETYFEADLDTNSLLILTSTKNYERIKPIIDELDKPVGQVLIKVLFAELSHSNSVDLGTEFSMLNLRNDGDFTQSATAFGSPLSGLTVQTVEGELDVTISALQESGRLNVLSRPYILTRNNQMATITVGEEVPIPTGSSQGTATTTTTFDYRDDIGIVLNVTPSINIDGLVNMIVTPQITTRTGETVQISEDLFPEVFATRSADTRVAVRDGQTIVIGGLIEDQITDTVRKIPLLGDIPIAGHLFRRTIKEKSKTELLIFLTPHVAKEAADLTPIYETERARSTLDKDEKTAEIFKRHMEGMQGPESKTVEPNEP
jgi:general secretion pathway protein D